MSWHSYSCLEAFIDEDEVDYTGDGQLVTVIMTDDWSELSPAVCTLTPEETRELAFELLAAAEHAEQRTREQESGR
jgi:hypothetical protein